MMAKNSAIHVIGEKELIRQLLLLEPTYADIIAVERKAAAIMRKEARRRVPKDTGALQRSITTVTLPKRGTKPPTVAVRPMWGSVTSAKTGKLTSGYHAHLVEFGTAERTLAASVLGSGGTKRTSGRMPAQPFMRPAWDATHERMSKFIVSDAWKLIAARARKAAARRAAKT